MRIAPVAAAAILLGGWAASLRAGDVLARIPADVPGVIVLPHPAATNQALCALGKRIDPHYEPIDLDNLAERLDVDRKSWDPSAPVVLILTKPELCRMSLVVGYHPQARAAEDQGTMGKITRCGRGSATCWSMARGGMVFTSNRRSALRVVRMVEVDQSLAAALDETERELAENADAFVRLNPAHWRQKTESYLLLAANMMKLGVSMSAEPPEAATTNAVVDWVAAGVKAVCDQMTSVTLAARFDGQTLKIVHHHRFQRGGSVAEYLASVRNEGLDMLATLPDRPFWAVTVTNWRSPPETSVTARMTEYVLGMEPVRAALKPRKHARLLADVRGFHGQTRGTALMLSSPADSFFPLEMSGSYVLQDADEGMSQLCFIQENACEALSILLPVGDLHTRFEVRHEGKREYHELKPNFQLLSKKMRQDLSQAYGAAMCYQYAVVGKQELMFFVGHPPANVVRLAAEREKGGGTLADNPQVRRLVERLPERPHFFLAVDLRHVVKSIPSIAAETLAGASSAATKALADAKRAAATAMAHSKGGAVTMPARSATKALPEKEKRMALFGWACRIEQDSLTGHFAADADDVVEVVSAARETIGTLKQIKTRGE